MFGNSDVCLGCGVGFVNDGGKCVGRCPSGFYRLNNRCVENMPNCGLHRHVEMGVGVTASTEDILQSEPLV